MNAWEFFVTTSGMVEFAESSGWLDSIDHCAPLHCLSAVTCLDANGAEAGRVYHCSAPQSTLSDSRFLPLYFTDNRDGGNHLHQS